MSRGKKKDGAWQSLKLCGKTKLGMAVDQPRNPDFYCMHLSVSFLLHAVVVYHIMNNPGLNAVSLLSWLHSTIITTSHAKYYILPYIGLGLQPLLLLGDPARPFPPNSYRSPLAITRHDGGSKDRFDIILQLSLTRRSFRDPNHSRCSPSSVCKRKQ